MGSWHGGSGAHWNAPSPRNLWHGWARYTHEPSVNSECYAMVFNLSFLWFTGFSDWEDDSVQQELPGVQMQQKQLFLNIFKQGWTGEFQIAMLSNLVSFFDV